VCVSLGGQARAATRSVRNTARLTQQPTSVTVRTSWAGREMCATSQDAPACTASTAAEEVRILHVYVLSLVSFVFLMVHH